VGNIDWVIKSGKDWAKKYGSNSKNTYTKESRRLKYCNSCKMVWEISTIGTGIHRYGHMPTYGLPRIVCRICKNKHER